MTASIGFSIFARDKASETFKNVGASASKSGLHLKDYSHSIKHVVEAFGLFEGVKKAGEFLKSSVEAASEDQAAQKRLAIALKNTTGANEEQIKGVDEWITKQSLATGVAKDDLMPAFQRLAQSTGSVTKAQQQLKLAQNISAGTGKNLTTVSMALQKANNGSLGGLSRLGVATKDAAGHTLTLKQVTSQLADTYAGQAKTKAQTFAGTMQRLHNTFHELQVRIGTALLPILQKLASWFLAKGVPAISKIYGWLADKLGPVFKTIGHWLSGTLIPAIANMVHHFQDGGKTTGKFTQIIHNLQPAFKLSIAVMKVLGKALIWLAPIVGKLMVNSFVRMSKVIGTVAKVGIWLWNNALQPSFKMILKGVGWLMQGWGKLLRALGHVPGFGWARRAGDAMSDAGRKASSMGDHINRIPNSHTTRIHTPGMDAAIRGAQYLRYSLAQIKADKYVHIHELISKPHVNMPNAAGGIVHAGHNYRVGENGPEQFVPAVDGRILSHRETQQMMMAPRAVASSGDTYVINVNGGLDSADAIAQRVQQALLTRKRKLGGRPLGIA